jgi:hypothetical protein
VNNFEDGEQESFQQQLQYIETLENTFATPGWKLLVQEAKNQIYQYQLSVFDAKNWDEVNLLKGNVEQLSRFVNLEEMIALMRKGVEDQYLTIASQDAEL